MTFVFVSRSVSEVLGAGIKLSRFGQRVELASPFAEETKLHGGLPCIPAEEFDAINFTDAELKSAKWENPMPSFLEKEKQALAVLHKIRGGE
jgi:hypothetical protein